MVQTLFVVSMSAVPLTSPLRALLAGMSMLVLMLLHFTFRPYRTSVADLSWMVSIGCALALLVVGLVLHSGAGLFAVVLAAYGVVVTGFMFVVSSFVYEWLRLPTRVTLPSGVKPGDGAAAAKPKQGVASALLPRLHWLYSTMFSVLNIVVPGFNDGASLDANAVFGGQSCNAPSAYIYTQLPTAAHSCIRRHIATAAHTAALP